MPEQLPKTPQAPQPQLHGGHTGLSFNHPILGLPEGMSLQEAHVLARQQNTATETAPEQPDAVIYPDLITSIPLFEHPSDSELTSTPTALTGPRQTGSYQLPNGNIVRSGITGDGMKETYTSGGRTRGPQYKTAAEFYASKGISVSEVKKPVNTQRKGRLARMLGRLSSSK